MSRKMASRVSVLFAFMLLFQTLLGSLVYPAQVFATGNQQEDFIKDVNPLSSDEEAEDEKVNLQVDWSVVGLEVEPGDEDTYLIQAPYSIETSGTGDLVADSEVTVGQYEASTTGEVTITFGEGIEEDSDAEGSFVVEVVDLEAVERAAEESEAPEEIAEENVDGEVTNSETDGEIEPEEGNEERNINSEDTEKTNDTTEQKKNDRNGAKEQEKDTDEETVEKAEISGQSASIIQPLAEVEQNLITGLNLSYTTTDGEQGTIENGDTVDLNIDDMNAVRLIYTLVKPDDLDIAAGDTYTIDLPEIFDQTILSPQPIQVGANNVVVGTYVIEDGKLIITFNDEVNGFDNVDMFVNITGAFNKEIFEEEKEVIVEIPYKDEGSFTVTIRAEQEDYEGEDKKTAGKQYILNGEEKVEVDRNPEFIDWTVRVNDSMESIDNAKVIDDLHENLEIVDDSIIVERIIRNYQNDEIGRETVEVTPTITETGFELELGSIEDAYEITYTTSIIRPDGGGTHTINNNARIILDRDETQVSDDFTGTWSGDIPSLQKSGKISDANADTIYWEVKYNYGQEEIGSNVTLTDTLTDGEVILSTVKVIEVETDVDGNVTEEIGTLEVDAVIDENGNLNIPGLDANDKSYYITFQSTVPVGLNDVEITNTIEDNYNNKDDASVTVNTIPTGDKIGEQLVDDDGNPYIEWTITMNSKKVDISSINITDVFSGEHLEFDAKDASLYELFEDGVEVENYTVTNYTHDDGRIGFKLQVTDTGPHEYRFVYRTYYKVEGMQEPSLANDAELIFDSGPGEGIGVDVDFSQDGPKAGISKTGKYVLNESTGLQEIEWTIEFNNSRILLENPVIEDAFTSRNYRFIEDSLSVKENDVDFTDFKLTPSSPTTEGFTLNINKNTNALYTITYRTTADDAENKDQVNYVKLTWQGGTEEASETVAKRDPGLNKSGKVVINDDGTKTVNWTVNFNTERHVIHKFVLTDTNISTVEVSNIKITSNNVNVTDQFDISTPTNGQFTVSKDQLDAVPYQLTYSTTLSPNEEKDIKNTAEITYTGGEDTKTATIDKPTLGVQKEAESIDKESEPNRINWKITANTDTNNHLVNLVDPVLIDDIPTDQKLVRGTIEVVRVSDGTDITDPSNITEEDNKFTINLPNGAYQYIVTFQTEILEFPSVNDKIDRYTNSTTLSNEDYDDVTDNAYIDYFADGSNNNNTKKGIVNEDTENIDWEAIVNPLGLTINNAVIEDKLGGNQTYVIDDNHQIVVKHEDGTEFDKDAYKLNVAEDKRNFTITFNTQINEPVNVSYSTRLDPELIGEYTVNNEIDMYGGEGRKKISSEKVSTTTSQWTYGGGGSGRTLGFTLMKENTNGDPVANTTFDFLRITPTGNEVPIDGTGITTDDEGKAEIENARAGRYKVTERIAPEGYERLTDPIYMIIGYGSSEDDGYVIKITDSEWNEIDSDVAHGSGNVFTIINEHKPVSVELEATKTLQGNKQLEANQFTFELSDEDGVIDTKTNDGRGNITFDELTYNAPGIYQYEVREVEGDLEGVTYSDQTHNVTVYVTKDDDGNLETEVSYGNDVPEFINTYQADPVDVTLEAQKLLEGLILTDGQFEFELVDESGDIVESVKNNETGKVEFTEIEYDMEGTYAYVIREVEPEEDALGGISYDPKEFVVTVTVEDNLEGKLTAAVNYVNGPAVFTNTYTPAPDSVVFEASKVLEGKTLEAEQFEFELVDESRDVVQTTSNNAEGKVVFDEITFDEVGDYTYYIREVQGNLGGVEYDESVFEFNVTVEDDEKGNLEATVEEVNGPAEFTNFYSAAPDTAVIEAHKFLEGQNLRAGQFTFELVEPNSENVIREAENNSRGQIIFEEIEYEEAGDYKYIIREVQGEQRGVTYDKSQFNVTVQVTDNGDGNLETEVIYEDGPVEFKNEYAPLPNGIVLEAEKVLNGQSLVDEQFTFELVDESGDVIQTAPNNADGQVIFEEITYETPGKHTYIIQEETGTQGGMTYDTSKYTVVVGVVDEEGQLEATANYIGGPAVFTNNYEADPDSVVIEASKILEGQDLRKDQFEFELLDGAGEVLQTAKNNANGQVFFNEITYDEVGIYDYSIREVKGTQGGVTYDPTVYNLNVEVVDGREGQLIATVNYTDGPTVFTNNYTPEPDSVVIEVEKVLEGQDLRNDQFTFELVDESGEVIRSTGNNTNGQVIFDEITYNEAGKHTYTIREVEGVQGGVTYDESQFEVNVTVTDDGEGQLTADLDIGEEEKIVFNNTYVPAPDRVVLEANKILEGQDLRNDQFEFQLLDKGGEVLQTAYNNASGQVIFEEITYDEVGEYTYTMVEVEGVQGGVTYDESQFEVNVTVTDDGAGQLHAEVNYAKVDGETLDDDAIPVFTNSYEFKGTSIELQAEKVLEGRDLAEDEFEFQLVGKDDNIDEIVSNDADGNIVFSEISYDTPGKYNYTIKEVAGDLGGVEYDETVQQVTVTVTDNGEGQLEAEAVYENEEAVFTNTYTTTPTEATISGEKILEGQTLEADQFSFELLNDQGHTIQTTENDAEGEFAFDAISYDEAGDYDYTVREVEGSQGGVKYDENVFSVTVSVTDNGQGELVSHVNYTDGPVSFTNTYEAAPDSIVFEAEKRLEGQQLTNEQFAFALFYDGNDEPIQTVRNNHNGQVIFEEVSFDEVGTYEYTIREVNEELGGITYDPTEYSVTVEVIDDGEGQLVATATYNDGPAVFTNTYTPDPDSIVLEAEKNLEGQELVNDQFTFELIDESGVSIQETTNNAQGQVIFDEIEYDTVGSHTYIIREVEGVQGGMTYDNTEYTVVVNVEDDGEGNLIAEANYLGGPAVFTNTYEPTPDSVVLEANKVLNGQELRPGQFTFELIDENDEVLQTKENNAAGQVIFDEIKYETAGDYNYTIREVEGSQGGIEYDEMEYEVIVSVTDDREGTLTAEAQYVDGPAEFTNTYTPTPDSVVIEVNKVLEGQELRNSQFTFELADKETGVVLEATNNANGQIIFDEITYDEAGEHTYTIREVEGVQGGVRYDESEYEVTVTVTDDSEGQLTAELDIGEEDEIVYTNTYVPSPDSVVFEASKILEGQDLRDDQFEFQLLDEAGNVLQTVTNNANGQVIFDEIQYDKVGEYAYTIREVTGVQGGVDYDTSEYGVIVSVTDDGEGQLTATEEYVDGDAEFTNHYSTAPVTVEFEAEKVLDGRHTDLEENEFTFEVFDAEENSVATGTNKADGVIEFETIEFTEVGSYEFTIREVTGDDQNINYDETTYSVTVEVTDNDEGQLVAEVVYAEEPIFTNEYDPVKVSVGDYVWFDENRDGLQDDTDVPLEGVVLTIEDENGNPVTDVYGNPIEPTTTDENGFYTFDNLPIDNTYTVRIDRKASEEALEGYLPTEEEVGDDQSIDSSTWEATSRHLTEDGERDPTLDFGFIVPEKVSVGDYVWIDENKDGLQDDTDIPLEGVVLTIEDENGDPVTDVYGNPVGPTTTDENGYYIFENLPIDNTYTVRIDQEASAEVLKDYVRTLEEVGDDISIDSSTWVATSRHLTEDGEHDPTLDFGFVRVEDPETPIEEPEEPETPGEEDPETPTDSETVDEEETTTDEENESEEKVETPERTDDTDATDEIEVESVSTTGEPTDSGDGDRLPSTATNIFNMLVIGLALIALAIGITIYRRRKSA